MLLGLAPDEVCHATTVTGCAVGSYPTISPLPEGGLLSVALSVALLLPAVSRRHILRCPDFPLYYSDYFGNLEEKLKSELLEILAHAHGFVVVVAVAAGGLSILGGYGLSFALCRFKLLEDIASLCILLEVLLVDYP